MLAHPTIFLAVWAVSSVVGGVIAGKVCALNDHLNRPFAGALGGQSDARDSVIKSPYLRLLHRVDASDGA